MRTGILTLAALILMAFWPLWQPGALEKTAPLPYTAFKQIECQPGELLTSSRIKGFYCAPLVPPCPASQYLAVSNNTLTCKTLNQNCPAGQVFVGVQKGTFLCAPFENPPPLCTPLKGPKSGEGPCTKTCGGGTKPVYYQDGCGGTLTETETCNTQECPPPVCVPKLVTTLGECSKTCGGGTRTVTTTDGCGKTETATQACNTQECPPPVCVPKPVTTLGECSKTCGGGTQTVTTKDGCGKTETRTQACNTQNCPCATIDMWNIGTGGGGKGKCPTGATSRVCSLVPPGTISGIAHGCGGMTQCSYTYRCIGPKWQFMGSEQITGSGGH